MSITNRGKYRILGMVFQAAPLPANYYLALATNVNPPTVDTHTLSEVSQIAAGNGYTANGYQLTPGVVDFPTLTEDDPGDLAKIILKDIIWNASGGSIPASGSGARWAFLTDDNATPANRDVIAFWDLQSDRAISDGQFLEFTGTEMRLTE